MKAHFSKISERMLSSGKKYCARTAGATLPHP